LLRGNTRNSDCLYNNARKKGGVFILRLFKKKETIQFSGRRHTRLGILSAMIGILTVIGFVAICIISGVNGGEAGLYIGIIGIFIFVLGLFGFVLSYKGLKQRDIYYRFPMIGIVTNGTMLIILMIIYILGLY
jgi:hypothetical protein